MFTAILSLMGGLLVFPILPLIGIILFVVLSLLLVFFALMVVGSVLLLLIAALIYIPASSR
jgi:hypothetical protein